MSTPRLSLVITTYERPDALEAVLRSALAQRDPPDEILVADDGSGPATASRIAEVARDARLAVRHLRQEHLGFRLTRLRNLAIAAARCDYIVFVDGDMVLHPCFVADHRRVARRGCWTQGVRIALDAAATAALQAAPLLPPGPLAPGLGGVRRLYGLHSPTLQPALRRLGNAFIAIKGCNQGFWRDDLVAVNGFEEAIEGWGPEDKELCARLGHHGLRRQTLLCGGIAWHLDHPPASRERRAANQRLLERTLGERRTRAERGLDAHVAPDGGQGDPRRRPSGGPCAINRGLNRRGVASCPESSYSCAMARASGTRRTCSPAGPTSTFPCRAAPRRSPPARRSCGRRSPSTAPSHRC